MTTEKEDRELADKVILRVLGPTPFVDAPETTRNPLTLLDGLVAGYMPSPDQARWLRRNFVSGIAQLERLRLDVERMKESS
jgi:hypothetical protein